MKAFKLVGYLFVGLLLFCNTAWALEVGQVDIHGFISQGYLESSHNHFLVDSEKGSFEYNEAAVNFSTNLTEKLRLGLQLMARDLGDAGNNEVLLDWGFADYRWRNELGLRFGKIKRPAGFYNEERDVDMSRTWVLLPQSIYPENLRDTINATEGVGVYGTINAGLAGTIEYQDTYGVSPRVDLSPIGIKNSFQNYTRAFLYLGEVIDPNDMTMTSKRSNSAQLIWNTPLDGLRFGASWGVDKLDLEFPAQTVYVPTTPPVVRAYPERTIDIKLRNYIFSGEYKIKNLTLAGEYLRQKMQWDYNTPQLAVYNLATDKTMLGYYGSIAYRFTDWLELGSYYSVLYPDMDDKHGDNLAARGLPDFMGWQDDAAFTCRIDINPSWILKLEGHHLNGAAYVDDYANVSDLHKDWTLYAVKTTFSF